MKTTRALAELGQSLWLDNITRSLLDSGTLQRYIDELDVTGLTSNPTIYDKAIGGSDAYDDAIAEGAHSGKSGEDSFFDIALADLRRAADLFRPVFERTDGVDGFVSLEVLGGFGLPLDVDLSFRNLIDLFIAGLRRA